MATNAKNIAELLNTDTTVAVGDIADGSVTTAKLAADAVTSAKLADNSVVTANITDDAVTSGKVNPAGLNLGRRNIIINGAMQISQRIGTTATAITAGNYGLDRWGMYYDGNSFTTQQVVDAPAGFYNSMKLTVTGTTTPNYSFFGQRIEGLNVNHIGLGTANCQSFTVSFYVKSSVAGVYSISMTNGAGDLAYPVQYTINSANTWERKTMTIPPITSGTWVRNNTNGLYLRMNLGSPSGRTAAANGWRSGNFDGADGSTGAVTWATTSGATFYMTGCQIEVGTSASDFEHRSHGEELSLCQRYFYRFTGHGILFYADYYSNDTMISKESLPVEMRVNPTVTTRGTGGSGGTAFSYTNLAATPTLNASGKTGVAVYRGVSSAARTYIHIYNTTADYSVDANAEL